MLQLVNRSPFEPLITVLPDATGVDTLHVVVRATFNLRPEPSVATEQLAPVAADVYSGDPADSSPISVSEIHTGKPGTDVVLIGTALPPGGAPVTMMDVALSVADRRKVVRVFGDRVWKHGMLGTSISPPESFSAMPLVYERAFGGVHVTDDGTVDAAVQNPVGRGFTGPRTGKELVGQPLPNLEDPGALIAAPKDRPTPASFGFIAPTWEPRRGFAGTYDEAWEKSRAPFLPDDFDPRYLNAAHPDLAFDRFLEGGEAVRVDGLTGGHSLAFSLPVCAFDIQVAIASRIARPRANLETVLIEPDENRLSLTFRAMEPCEKQSRRIREVAIDVSKLSMTGDAA